MATAAAGTKELRLLAETFPRPQPWQRWTATLEAALAAVARQQTSLLNQSLALRCMV